MPEMPADRLGIGMHLVDSLLRASDSSHGGKRFSAIGALTSTSLLDSYIVEDTVNGLLIRRQFSDSVNRKWPSSA